MILRLFTALFVFFFSASCVLKKEKTLLINGAGASFPYILYSKWITEYRKTEPSVRINYQSIGSGGGIRQFLAGTLDFGGTDIPLFQESNDSKRESKQSQVRKEESVENTKTAQGTKKKISKELDNKNLKYKKTTQNKEDFKKPILHIPTALGAVAVTYNLPSLKNEKLKLTGSLLAEIFRGEIKFWNDSQIQNLNKGLNLPEQKIILIYRADGSGTTSFFTEFLSLRSSVFLKQIGYGKSVSWPRGLGAKGNEGVMGLLNKMEGAISYVGLSYALSQKLPVAAVENKEGFFVEPALSSIQAAALSAIQDQESYTNSLIDIKGAKSYPISGYTYFIISRLPEPKGSALFSFVKWTLMAGQDFSKELHFIPLPPVIQNKAVENLSMFKNKI